MESVINQTASAGIREIIIVNDGSTDGSTEVIASLVDREPRIHVLTTAGIGPSSARNLAIRHATGDFIAFLDGDDFWAEDKLERQLTAFDNGCKAALVYGDLVDFSAPDLSDAVPVAVGRYRADQCDTLPTYFCVMARLFLPVSLCGGRLLKLSGCSTKRSGLQRIQSFACA
ncbi:hypothetical protein AJ88_12795 [Mesorhizobium amorphae CCBAU 01583]|nr:hypothetical protein AJ88_12795 [Mesorhizobium amorphae CCBAU 01583]